jgi:preprotein translocase subunit SecD
MDQKQQNILLLVLCAVLVAASWALLWPPAKRITQGLDIQGGLSVILTAQESTSTPVTAAVMDRAELIVRNRVDRLGVREASIQQQGNDSLLVQIPGIRNAQEALAVLGSTGQLEFVDVASITDSATVAAISAGDENVKLKAGTYTPFMTGEVVRTAAVSQDPNTAQIEVNITMDSKGTKTWADYTTANVGKLVAIVLDGTVQSAPRVNEPITAGQTAISGSFTVDTAKQLKTVLETGALPVTLEFSESRVVGPTLGQDSLRQGILAVVIGICLVALYVLVFYRGLGLLTVVALATFASLFLGILALLSRLGFFALTLPGIAGIVLTIGLAADSSILILERFKEEVRLGKTIRSAANSGSRHGMFTSIDADLVTLVSAAVLYFVAIGPVRGFALTLMIGIACDITMMVLFKRPILILLGESVIAKAPAFWGVPKERAAAPGGNARKGGVANA